jgi:hypothetical protein
LESNFIMARENKTPSKSFNNTSIMMIGWRQAQRHPQRWLQRRQGHQQEPPEQERHQQQQQVA